MGLTFAALNIGKSYDGSQVLKECSFSFDGSSVYVLTGPNGCGKSTFLRICALIEPPDEGEILFSSQGKTIEKDLRLRRRMTLVFPRAGVFNTTAFRNVSYGLTIRGIRGAQARAQVCEALEFVGLGHKSDQNALTLSSGETQRLNIARALVIKPEILFLDEPTASVDQSNTEIIENIVMKLKKERNTSVVITTHDKEQAKRLADRNLIVQNWKVVEDK
ncbi:MAG: ATP-binding cassette domain-containing protein [Dissulfurispiraceae bacterium]|jgi:tungstate transport system ATP-binding protein